MVAKGNILKVKARAHFNALAAGRDVVEDSLALSRVGEKKKPARGPSPNLQTPGNRGVITHFTCRDAVGKDGIAPISRGAERKKLKALVNHYRGEGNRRQ